MQMSPEDISNKLRAPFPTKKVKKNFQGYEYVPPEHVVDRLNDVLGIDWDFTIEDIKIVPGEDSQEVICIGEMKIGGRSKQGIGTDTILWKANNGNPMVDPIGKAFKSAASNCMKLCARLFGVGNHLWGGDLMPVTAVMANEVQQADSGHNGNGTTVTDPNPKLKEKLKVDRDKETEKPFILTEKGKDFSVFIVRSETTLGKLSVELFGEGHEENGLTVLSDIAKQHGIDDLAKLNPTRDQAGKIAVAVNERIEEMEVMVEDAEAEIAQGEHQVDIDNSGGETVEFPATEKQLAFLEKIVQRDDLADEDRARIRTALAGDLSKADASDLIAGFARKRSA